MKLFTVWRFGVKMSPLIKHVNRIITDRRVSEHKQQVWMEAPAAPPSCGHVSSFPSWNNKTTNILSSQSELQQQQSIPHAVEKKANTIQVQRSKRQAGTWSMLHTFCFWFWGKYELNKKHPFLWMLAALFCITCALLLPLLLILCEVAFAPSPEALE